VVISADVNFIFYKSGILNTCGEIINHAIQLVGIIKNSTSNYYIGRNSWGVQWGDGGYVYIDSKIKNGNLCNVCTYPQYPL
jgi:C1A family cysteine protease